MRQPLHIGRSNEELLADIIAELHRLAQDGVAPSSRQWQQHRVASVPSLQNIKVRLGLSYADIVDRAGLLPYAPPPPPTIKGLSQELERHVAEGATPANWMDRFRNVLTVLPTPTRRETVQGRTISGEPCVIYREYFLVR